MLVHRMFESYADVIAKAFPERGECSLLIYTSAVAVGGILCPRIFDSVLWEVLYLRLRAMSKIGVAENPVRVSKHLQLLS